MSTKHRYPYLLPIRRGCSRWSSNKQVSWL